MAGTIKDVVKGLSKIGLKVKDKESTWAESKMWLVSSTDLDLTPGHTDKLYALLRTHGRKATVEKFGNTIFLSFPKTRRAASLISWGFDPTDMR